jgi:hypothetical protein
MHRRRENGIVRSAHEGLINIMIYQIIECNYNVLSDMYHLFVKRNDRVYLIQVRRIDVLTLADLQRYVENDIRSQQQPVPDWTGVSWTTETNE